ncbi:MAG TPA: Ig-like domain-containing protein, partial [Novosphingobium sp.]|nr:Ig-like domain-containing protein [Novosphingobium sp.]
VGGTNSWGGGANASTGTGVMQVSSVKAYATAGTVQETVNGVTTYFTNGNATSTATTLTSGTNGAPPVANADSFATKECAALTVSAANGVLANDTSSTNLALSAVLDTTTLHGKLVLNADGSFSYTPTAGYVGADSFTYQAEDSKGNFSSATTVSLNVTQVTPTANADSFAGKEGTALSVSAANGVLANDTGASGLALSAVLGTTTQHGALALNADGSFTYTPNAGYSGTDSFTYQAKDSTGALSSAATVTLNVAQVLPSATSYTGYTTAYEAPLTIAATTLLAGASDAAGYPLSVTGVSNAVGGTVSFSNGLITFTPASWYSGAASFSYTVADAYGDTATASVNLSVGAEVKPSSLYIYGGTANQTIDKHLSSFGWMINAGSGNDIILGGAGSNSLNAGTGNTTLIGGASADLLQAGTGVDVLTGGGGADTFLFAAGTLHKLGSAGGIDSITDFISGGVASVHDVIKFSGFGAGASLSYTSTNTDGSFNYHVTAGSYSGDLIIQSGGHKLVAADYLFM